DGDHFAWSEPALLDDLRGVDAGRANLGTQHYKAVLRQTVARRAEAIAVETRTNRAAVAENKRGWTIPGLVEARIVLIESGEFGRNGVIGAPGRRHQHGDRVQEAAPAHHERFERVVDAGGIGSSRLDDGLEQIDVLAPEIRAQFRLARVHPVAVAA